MSRKNEYNRKDSFYHKAKDEGYRSRAAFKLLEIHQKYKIIPTGGRVLDLGAWPGSWIQVCLNHIGPKGQVVGIDLVEMEPFSDSRTKLIQGDVSDDSVLLEACRFINRAHISPALTSAAEPALLLEGDSPLPHDAAGEDVTLTPCFDLVVSDMSPKLCGIREVDAHNTTEIAQLAYHTAKKLLKPGGSLVIKVFKTPESLSLSKKFTKSFKHGVTRVELDSTRKSSNEFYLVGRGLLT